MREDELPRVLRSGTSEFAALADVPSAALIRQRGDRRRRRNAVLSGVLAFVIGAGGGGIAYASLDKTAHHTPAAAGSSAGGPTQASGGASETAPAGAAPGIVAVTTAGVVEVLDPETFTQTRQLVGVQDAIGDEVGVSPDGRTVYFAVKKNCADVIESVPADGSAAPVQVAQGVLPAVSQDGKHLAYVAESGSGGPHRVSYTCPGTGGEPTVWVLDLASKLASQYPVPGHLPVSHLSWAPNGTSLLVSAGPADGNTGWALQVLSTASGMFSAPVPVTGDNAATSYYREGIYLPGGGLFVNRICCTGLPAAASWNRMLRIDAAGNELALVAKAFLDKDHTSLQADPSGQWILYLSGNDLFVSAGGQTPKLKTKGLIAAAWL